MLILLSPAKNLDWAPPPEALAKSAPRFAKETAELAKVAKGLRAADLSRLMEISDKLAELNWRRFQEFDAKAAPDAGKQAALAFNGDVYQGLAANSLSPQDLDWAQKHLRILSGLYGLLRPLDAIQPYRLEMGVKLATKRGETLYDFWDDKIAKALNADLESAGGGPILNLASEEYFGAVNLSALKAPVISFGFKDVKDGKARPVFMFVKRARGAFARYVIEKRLTDPEKLKKAVVEGYRFDPADSTDAHWTFTRPQPPPAAARRRS